jgi:hypothetical protein
LTIIASGVENSEDNDHIGLADEEDAIGKSTGQHTADFGLASQAGISQGIFSGAADRSIDLGEELIAQTCLLLLIPDCRVGDVELCVVSDDDPVSHPDDSLR